jgi:membrane fusion protein, multidrug efflux system
MEPTERPSDPAASDIANRPGTSPPAAKPRHRSRWIALLLILIAAGAGYFGWQRYAATSGASPEAAAPPPQTPPTVTVSQPLAKDIVEWDEYTGQFAAVDSVEIRARVSGYLESIHFEDGQIVHAGDLLFVIDPRPFEIALASAKAQLDLAQASYDLAQAQLKRAEKLRQNDFASASAYDERLQQSRGAAATINLAKAAVQAAELDLDYTHITSPITGRVSAHAVSVGNLVAGGSGSGTTLLTTVVSLDPIHLLFDISESNLLAYQRAIAEGRLQSVRDGSIEIQAQLMDDPAWSLKGRIDFLDNRVDRTAGTIRVRAVLPNPDLLITPGQFGRVRIPGSDRYRALLVPEAAIVTDQARKLLYTVAADGTVVPKPVRLGPNRGPELRIIREGLEPTDRIIIDGLLRARPGAKVTPQEGSIDLPDPEE